MKTSIVKKTFIYLLSIFCLLPLIVMVIKSFQGINGGFTMEQYGRALFQTQDFFIGFWNSIIYTVVIIAINLPISLLAAYGFSRFNFPGRDILFWVYIVLMLMPFQATIVPQYLALKALGILDTPEAVILPNAFSTFGTFLMAQYMRGLDNEVFDAGRIDGLNEFSLMIKIVMPICKPIVSALVVLLFINYWSMVEQPIIFISDRQFMPLSVLLSGSSNFLNIAFACGVIFTVLPLLLYLFSYRDLTQGIALSAAVETGGEGKLSNKRNYKSDRKRIGILMVSFLIAMILFTLITQKVAYIMTAEVETVSPFSGDLREDSRSTDSKSLGYFRTILPAACVKSSGSKGYVYVVQEEKSKSRRNQAIKVMVDITAQNESYYAVSGPIMDDAQVVRYTSRPLGNGSYVRILDGGDIND